MTLVKLINPSEDLTPLSYTFPLQVVVGMWRGDTYKGVWAGVSLGTQKRFLLALMFIEADGLSFRKSTLKI